MKKYIFIFIILLISGCNGLSDDEVVINDEMKFIKTNPTTFSVNNSSGGTFIIEPTIEEINWDEEYLIAKRNHRNEMEYYSI